jgi:hypothetical protein
MKSAFLARACALTTGLLVTAAQAAAPAAIGQKALLTMSIQVEGAGTRVSKSDGVDVKWSTRRALDVKMEMVATKLQNISAAAVGDGTKIEVPQDLAALQKESEKCKPDDTACQMAIAMKMMNSQGGQKMIADGEAQAAKPPRFQTWNPAPKGGRLEVTGDYQEKWDGIFLTASKEVRDCKAAFSGATTNPALAARDRETLKLGLQGNHVEVDTQTGKSSLMLVIGSYVVAESRCHINDGGRKFDENENKNLLFAPPLETSKTGGWVAGGTAAGTAISRGELNFVTKPDGQSMTGMMSVTAPMKVRIRWELVPL